MATISEIMKARSAVVCAMRHLIAIDDIPAVGVHPAPWLAVAAAFCDDAKGMALFAQELAKTAQTAMDSPRFCQRLRELADLAMDAHAGNATGQVGA